MFGKGLLVFVLLLLPIHALSRQGAFKSALLTVPGANGSRASVGEVDRRRYDIPPLHRQLLQVEPENGPEDTEPKLSNSSSNGSTSPSEKPGPKSSVDVPSAVQLRDSELNSIRVSSASHLGTGCSGGLTGADSGIQQLTITAAPTQDPFGSVVVGGAGQPDQNDCGESVAESDDEDD